MPWLVEVLVALLVVLQTLHLQLHAMDGVLQLLDHMEGLAVGEQLRPEHVAANLTVVQHLVGLMLHALHDLQLPVGLSPRSPCDDYRLMHGRMLPHGRVLRDEALRHRTLRVRCS